MTLPPCTWERLRSRSTTRRRRSRSTTCSATLGNAVVITERQFLKPIEAGRQAGGHLRHVVCVDGDGDAVAVLGEEWLPAGDELTPTMKLKRKSIAGKYAATIEELYASRSGGSPRAKQRGEIGG